MSKKIMVLGAGGMLGKQVVRFARLAGHEVVVADRVTMPIINVATLSNAIHSSDSGILINCVGVVPQKLGERYSNIDMIQVNAVLPHVIHEVCKSFGVFMVQVSTDCVFSGNMGNYAVGDQTDPVDLYGKTKVVGEVGDLIVRTSFIGFEHGLLSWLISNRGGKVDGYGRAFWSGSTVYEVARNLIILCGLSVKGTAHLSTAEWTTTKYDLLLALNESLGLGIEINKVDLPKIDRTLKPNTSIQLQPVRSYAIMKELVDEFVGCGAGRA